jgi:hypothetical protein
VDSDDMIDGSYSCRIIEHPFTEGEVFCFGDGYLVEYQTNRLFEFMAQGGHLPFIVYYITKEALKSPESCLEYLNKWKMNVHHYNINKAPNKHIVPGFCWMMSTNKNNTSTAIGNPNVDKRLGAEIIDERRKVDIFERMGYNYNHDL